jgi:hypothetical protein
VAWQRSQDPRRQTSSARGAPRHRCAAAAVLPWSAARPDRPVFPPAVQATAHIPIMLRSSTEATSDRPGPRHRQPTSVSASPLPYHHPSHRRTAPVFLHLWDLVRRMHPSSGNTSVNTSLSSRLRRIAVVATAARAARRERIADALEQPATWASPVMMGRMGQASGHCVAAWTGWAARP